MAQTNFTPILLYASSTPTNVPSAANLTNSATGSEIAINVADKNLFFKDSTNAVNTVPIRQSSTSSNGWLSSTDWNTFNNKGLGTVTSVAALTLGTTGTDLSSTVANGTTTPVITLQVPTASATNRGALSAADWSTFNGKQATLVSGTNIKTVGGVSLLGSGDVGTIGVGYGGTGLTTLTAGYIPYGNGTSAFASSANLYFSGTNLGIGISSPIAKLNVQDGSISVGSSTNTTQTNTLLAGYGYNLTGTPIGNTAIKSSYSSSSNLASLEFYTDPTGIAPTERMRIHALGGVSIGNTTDPGANNLSVTGDIHSNSKISIGTAFNGTTGQFATDGTNTYLDYAGTLNIRAAASSVNRMTISSTGTVTMTAYGAGAATFSAAGVISSVSDETWKIKDGVPVNPDEMLQKLNPGYWFYNEEKAPIFGEDRQLGFYAQNVNAAIGFEAAPVPEEGKPWGYYDRSVLAITVMSLKNALNTIEELNAKFDAYVASHP